MQNAAAVEALYSATFVEDYLDTLENLPNELQRQLSRLREHDVVLRRDFVSEMDAFITDFENDNNSIAAQKHALGRLQKALISAQDIGDDKLASVQNIADIIEGKSRLLEQDARNLQFDDDEDRDQDEYSDSHKSNSNKGVSNEYGRNGHGNTNGSSSNTKSKSGKGGGRGLTDNREEVQAKPPPKRRKKQGTQSDRSISSSVSALAKEEEESSSSSRTAKKRGSTSKRRQQQCNSSKQSSKGGQDDSSDKEIDWSTLDIDPDEPTYCLCDQVSYGDMIGCDNDLCPIEWFHFSCVELSSKPKGKWFCPRCRGDKATVMKPKAQFLKELEKYNKEREEKLVKMAAATSN